MGHLFEKVKTGLARDVTKDAVDAKDLKSFANEPFADALRVELALALQGQLDRAYLGWTTATESTVCQRAFIHPPMTDNPLTNWSARHGLPILNAGETLSDLKNEPCVVVPDLESYFSRNHTQLTDLFDFFYDLSKFSGKVIVGCNSWAWQFLKQFDDAHLLFDDIKTMPAFDAEALASLLMTAQGTTDQSKNIIAVASGNPILARDGDDTLKDPYLDNLAGLSLGLPWVALEIFLDGIAQNKEEVSDQHDNCIWAALPTACSLASGDPDSLLFALHALMIHGARPVDELTKLLPHRAPNGLWSELERKGFVEIRDGKVQCALQSYPSIRSELGAAGFNLDTL